MRPILESIKITRFFNSLFLLVCHAFLSSCAFKYNSTHVVQSAVGSFHISHVGINDRRHEFINRFCRHYNKNRPDQSDCEHFLTIFGDEKKYEKKVKQDINFENIKLFIVPGIFGECVAETVLPFELSILKLAAKGLVTNYIPVEGRSSSSKNAVIIKEFFENFRKENESKIVLLGYSKGVPDILEAVSKYEGLASKIDAIVSISGAINGSPLADNVISPIRSLIKKTPNMKCDLGDMGAIESLSKRYRLDWMSNNTLPNHINYYSVVTAPDKEHVSNILKTTYNYLSKLSQSNDSQLLVSDQIIPNSNLLVYLNADHWVSLPYSQKAPFLAKYLVTKNNFPRLSLLNAIIETVDHDLVNKYVEYED